jgi:glycosyltransferase involved in cell wall biosynthesis
MTIEHGGSGLRTKRHHWLWYRLIASRATRTTAISQAQIPQLLRRGYQPARISVIPNGIDRLSPTKPRTKIRHELKLDEKHFLALLVATLRPEKRAAAFVDIVVAAHRRRPELRGLVVGGGPHFHRIRNLAASSGGVVEGLGERHDVANLIHAADAVCLTSSVEGVPAVLLEAMALARPIIAPNIGGIADVVQSSLTGVLVASGNHLEFVNALDAMVADRAWTPRLGREGKRRFAGRFTADKMIAAYVRTLDELLSVDHSLGKRRRRISRRYR